ncbi:MAG: glutamate dehydrogenase, partial [Novosphingobium sp.]
MASSTARSGARSNLTQALAQQLKSGLLPGDAPFSKSGLESAAQFVAAAAAERSPGEATIAIETVSGSASERFMRIAIINDDMPFLVDSIATTIFAQGLEIDRLVHPVVAVQRDAKGKLVDLADAGDAARESMIYLETGRADAKARRALESALRSTLGDVRVAVADWPKMQTRMAEDADGLADDEGAELLRWFKDGALTQLGYALHHRDGTQSGALGVCRRSAKVLLGEVSWDRAFAWFDNKKKGQRLPLVVKSNRISQVHRRTPLDLFIVPVSENGKVTALSAHMGLWTSAALLAPPTKVPQMRAQLDKLTKKLGFAPQGHAGKALVHALTELPHDILIGFSDSEIERVATTAMSLVDRPRPKLALVPSSLTRHLHAFVWLPRDVMSTGTRLQIEKLLVDAASSPVLDWSLEVEGNLALLRFVLDLPEVAKLPDEAALDARIQGMLRGWNDAVEDEIVAREEEDAGRAAAIAARHAEAFPLAYRSIYGPAEAAIDISRLRRLSAPGNERDARLHCLTGDCTGTLRLKLYQRHGSLALSDVVPALENFGFKVIEDQPTELDEGRLGTIHDFTLGLPAGLTADALMKRSETLEAALAAVLNGMAEDDPFNRLIAGVGLSAREANWLRAWYRYLRQAGVNYGIATAVDALQNAPAVTKGLIHLFRIRHDPAHHGDRTKGEALAQGEIRDGLAGVSAINDDRLLRLYRALIEAMLRTNAF